MSSNRPNVQAGPGHSGIGSCIKCGYAAEWVSFFTHDGVAYTRVEHNGRFCMIRRD